MTDHSNRDPGAAPVGALAFGAGLAQGAELRRLVEEWSGQRLTFPDALTLGERFEAAAMASAERVALTYENTSLTYAELNARANQLAHFLRAQGIQPESLVGVYLERGIDLLVAILGIVKSGGAYLPMDVAYPADRVAFMVEDGGARIVLSSRDASRGLDLPTSRLVLMDADRDEIATHPSTNLSVVVTPDSLAYVIYTSGSTGKPKGCEVRHRNAVRLFEASQAMYEFSADDVWTLFHSCAFDFSVWEIWGPWVHGARLVVVPQTVSRSPALFLDLLSRERVTFLNQTPSAFKQLTAAVAARAAPVPLALRIVILGGEAVELEALRPWINRYGDETPTLVNGYGPTECTVFSTFHHIRATDLDSGAPTPIGTPMPDVTCYILDAEQRVCAIGTPGELCIGGAGVTRGYLRRDELTAQKFIDWSPAPERPAERLYRSGDLVRWLPSGVIEYQGRIDQQVKIRGFRIEPGEIESVLAKYDGVITCAVVARTDRGPEPRLVGYVVANGELSYAGMREFMKQSLPDYMVPSAFVKIAALPMTTNGKLDQRALPAPEQTRPELSVEYAAPIGALETACCDAFATMLQLDRVGRHDNFFELGGDSLLAVQAAESIERTLGRRVSAAALFTNASPADLAAAVTEAVTVEPHGDSATATDERAGAEPIALIALASRLPGADTTEEFWANLLAERDSVTVFRPEELDASVADALRADSAYVPARTVLRDPEGFDPAFFGLTQREGEIMDPQQRLLLELSWEVLERAGYAPDRTARDGHTVGVFAGVYSAEYLRKNVYAHPELVSRVGDFAAMLATDKDYVTTRIAHRLNLTGPAVSIHTACSTALVAIVQAFDSLRAGRCDMAIAGGASMTYPPRSGYLYQEGAMLSKDGVTRTFDASASGTVFGDGGAVVLMKRLSDAIRDHDQIYAVIRGAGLNNDGGAKASFTAPSVDGQAKVIAAAHRDAQVDARSISYIEAHGTATPLGDPVEVEALTKAFRQGARGSADTGFCRIGTAKSNVGHVVAAAGAVGVIKTALSLSNETIPATLHFRSPNPKIDFANSPFVVNHQRTAWPRGDAPRRAGVSAFGVGGTNAHVVLEEAPVRVASSTVAGPHVLRLSARTPAALGRAAAALAAHLREQPDVNLADVAFTLREGRSEFSHRMTVIARDVTSGADALEQHDHALRATKKIAPNAHAIIFAFPGQGTQYPGMGSDLYSAEPVFRDACDEVFAALRGVTDFDLKAQMFATQGETLMATAVTQPATFCMEYALARLWHSRGIVPSAMIGHSIGEFVAAVIGGVMALPDAARLVARRGQLMNALPAGSMLSVRLGADKLRDRIPASLSLAADNGPGACVVAGSTEDVASFAAALERDGVLSRLLQTSHAFHSAMMDPVLEPFEREMRATRLSPPLIPIISTLTGKLLSAAEATDPAYWARHLRHTVRFSSAVQTALCGAPALFLEVGARHSLSTLIRQHPTSWPGEKIPATVPTLTDGPITEREAFALAVGQLWMNGINADGASAEGRCRVRLPTYQFERVRCWVDATPSVTTADVEASSPLSRGFVSAASVMNVTVPVAVAAPVTPQPVPLSQASSPAPSVMSAPASADRRPTLISRLRTVFEDVSGSELDDADPFTSFVELGLDSLVLTQAAIQVKKTFAVSITFRQMMEEYRSLDALAGFLDSKLAPDAVHVPVAAPVPVAAAASVAASAAPAVPQPVSAQAMMPVTTAGIVRTLQPARTIDASASSFAQQVIQQQLAIMEQQLALLGSVPTTYAAAQEQSAVAGSSAAAAAPSAPLVVAAAPATSTADEEAALAHKQYDVKKAFGAIARIHTRPTSELTDRQQRRLDAFMRSYVARTKASKAYTEAHRSHLADPRVVNGFRPQTKEICYQIVINKSKGSRMWDLDGNEYIDVLSGFGMNLFGWSPDFVNDAVKKQLDEGHDIGPQHPLAGEVADLLCELTGFDRAALCNTGSEAVMGAMRIARTVTGRDLIVIFTGSYHGIFDEVLVRGTKKLRAIPAAPGILQAAVENVLVLDYGTPESLEIIRSRAHELAAVLLEPVQSRRPDFQPVDFLREVRKITEESGTVLIFDEVITGFRSHPRGAQGLFGITADLASYGKVIGGGYPIGVIAGKRQFMDALDGGAWQFGDDSIPAVGVTYFAGTFVRHPLALAACKASLMHLKNEGALLQAGLSASTTAMAAEMNAFVKKVGAPLEIRYFASLWRVTWLEEHPLQDLLWAMMRNRGIHVLDNFPCFMTTAHTEADIAAIIRVFKEALTEMIASGFLPGTVQDQVVVADSSQPPVPNARLGRNRDGSPAWFVPDPQSPGQYLKLMA